MYFLTTIYSVHPFVSPPGGGLSGLRIQHKIIAKANIMCITLNGILQMANEKNGMVTFTEVAHAGISRAHLTVLVDKGFLERENSPSCNL